MDIIDSIKKDKAYCKYKSIVKNWEKDFKLQFSRTPSKFDIKEAPTKIKYAYKKYFQLKSAALETSLSICDFNDESDCSPEIVQPLENVLYDSRLCDTVNPQSNATSHSEQILPVLPSGEELEKLLSTAQKKQTSSEEPLNHFTDSLSKKLFQNSKFALRNPRKLILSKSQSTALNKNTGIDKENNDNVLLNNQSFTSEVDILEPILSFSNHITSVDNKSTNTNITMPDYLIHTTVKSTSLRKFDDAWLDRAAGINTGISNRQESGDKSKNVASLETFGLRNIKVNKADKTNDYVENSESDTEDNTIVKLKPALKKTKLSESIISQSEERNSIEDEHAKTKKLRKSIKKEQNKQLCKRKDSSAKEENINEKPPDISEYLPFGLEENIVPRHTNPEDILKTIAPPVEHNCSSSVSTDKIDKLQRKINSGSLNDNFVKINIEKKVFVRGKKNLNYSKYKKQQWKDKKALHASMEFPESGKITCFKCGAFGHMARYCTSHREETLLPLENYDESEIPTLKDMENIVLKETNSLSLPEELNLSVFEPSTIPDSFLKLLNETPDNDTIKPIYSDCQQPTPEELNIALQKFGHHSFRPGQEEAIKRILCGMSTLLVLSTGGGKSLCYQLPAYIYSQHYKCLTLVISPLVSLMEDQVLSMPAFLKAGCLHTNQSPTQRQKIIQSLKDGEINILLISPEALIAGDGSSRVTGLFKSLPQIAFACIDEAHCVSQWSHNFRPSYLMICRVLREKLNIKCILGLTATASKATIKSIISHINVPDGLTGVIINPTLPDNLCLSVSFEKDKDRALVSFLTSERISSFNSIIVYCIRRDECERVAAVLRSCLQEPGKINMEQSNKRKRMSYIAEAYHAGMSAAQRKKIQKHFMDGTLKIIIATVAFGMGINKSDIRCIIHYNMPCSFESYVQEVGRAGRDGKPAFCHVFMNNSNNDKNELLKHIHANTIDRPTIRKLLQKVFVSCQCGKTKDTSSTASIISRCKGHEVAIPVDSSVEELDLPSENIATLLCYVELHPKQYIKVLNNAYTMCKISSYGGPQKILEAAKICPPLAMAYLLESKKDQEITKKSIFEFHVIDVAAAIGWESGMTKYHLKNLEWITQNGVSKRSHLKIEFNTLGFRIKAPGDLSSAELDSILDDLHECVLAQEKAMLYQLEESNRAFIKIGNYSMEHNHVNETFITEKSNELKDIIRNYFQRENNIPTDILIVERPLDTERVTSDVRALISSYKDCNFTGRSIARIFQGISSPNYPAIVWGRCKFWRSHLHEDFYGLVKIATQQIIQMKMM